MERVKALLAVALFVAGLIFATPMTKDYTDLTNNQSRSKTQINQSTIDTISSNPYTFQPVSGSDITQNVN